MHWVAPSEKDAVNGTLERKLWAAADQFRANPPFNVNVLDGKRLKDSAGRGRRFPFGLRSTENANFLRFQLFHSTLNTRYHFQN